jgi:hypothetical protein
MHAVCIYCTFCTVYTPQIFNIFGATWICHSAMHSATPLYAHDMGTRQANIKKQEAMTS